MAGYTKLFNSILASTIWREDDKTRIVWITLLAMADKDGVAEGSIPGIADFARVSVADCRRALGKLQAPDIDSRTGDDDGRRIQPVPGGWLIINHGKYRSKLSEDERREYLRQKQAEFRLKKRQSINVNNVSDKSTLSTQAEAEAEAEAKADTEADPEKIKNVSSAPLKGRAAEPAELERVMPFLTFPTIGKHGHEWTLSEERLAEWGQLYPGLDLHSEARKALAWVGSSPSHRKTADGMPRFLVNWFNRATNRRVTTTVRHERRGAKSIAEQNFAGLAEDLRHDK